MPPYIYVRVVLPLGFGLVVGLLAWRKNRNPWLWGLGGAISLVIALLILAFLPYRCPKCGRSLTNKQGIAKECPGCGSFKRSRGQAPAHSSSPPPGVRTRQADPR